MAASLREQITTTSRGKVPTQDPDRTTGVSIEKGLISPAKRSLKHISGGEAAFRSVLMGAMIGTPIADSKAVDGVMTALDNGTAGLHERAVSTFSATLEQAANTVSPEFMLEQVTQAVQTYEKKHDDAWVNTPEETVRRAAEASGYNPDEITGGRSEILLRDLEKIRLQLEAGEKVTAFEILETFIFQSLGRYEDIATGDIVAVWKDGEKEYSSKQDAWEDIFSTQTLRNVMNETLATLAGSQADASDPAAPTATQDPAGDPTDSPTEAPSTPTDNPEPSATPDIATPEPVPTEQQNLDISNEVDQITVIEQTTQSDKYVYVNETTITPPEGVTLEGGRSVFLDNANIQREVIREQGLAPGYTSVHVRSDELVNTVTTFDQAGTSIYVPVISVDGQTFYSSSTSKAYFDVEIPEGAKPKYEAVSLPPNTNPESVTVRFQGEAEILEVTDNVGNQWVWDFRKGEFVSMIDRPATAEMRAALPDYVAAYARTAQPGQEELFKTPEVVMDRLEEAVGVAKDGTAFKALIDPQTNTILFLKTQNEESGEWEWEMATAGKLREHLGLEFTITNAEISNFNEQQNILEMMCGSACEVGIAGEMQMNMVFQQFGPDEWINVLENWETISNNFSVGKVPENYPYNWSEIDSLMDDYNRMANGAGVEIKFKSGLLLWPTFDNLTSGGTTKLIHDMNLPQEDNLKLLEFMVKTRVINYPEIESWNVSDEVNAGEVLNEPNLVVWNKLTGLSSPELIAQIATWVKESNPDAQTIMNEHGVFNYNNNWTQATHDQTLRTLEKLSNMGAPIDAFMDQQNLWIGTGIDQARMTTDIQKIKQLGFDIAGSEIMISVNPNSAIDGNTSVRNPAVGNTTEEKQAQMYRDLLLIYVANNINHIGFGGFEDNTAWTIDAGQPEASPTLFDTNFQPKLAYYYIMQAMSELLLNN